MKYLITILILFSITLSVDAKEQLELNDWDIIQILMESGILVVDPDVYDLENFSHGFRGIKPGDTVKIEALENRLNVLEQGNPIPSNLPDPIAGFPPKDVKSSDSSSNPFMWLLIAVASVFQWIWSGFRWVGRKIKSIWT